MKVLGTVTANSYQIVTNGDEAIGSMLSSDSKRGGALRLSYQQTTGPLMASGYQKLGT